MDLEGTIPETRVEVEKGFGRTEMRNSGLDTRGVLVII